MITEITAQDYEAPDRFPGMIAFHAGIRGPRWMPTRALEAVEIPD